MRGEKNRVARRVTDHQPSLCRLLYHRCSSPLFSHSHLDFILTSTHNIHRPPSTSSMPSQASILVIPLLNEQHYLKFGPMLVSRQYEGVIVRLSKGKVAISGRGAKPLSNRSHVQPDAQDVTGFVHSPDGTFSSPTAFLFFILTLSLRRSVTQSGPSQPSQPPSLPPTLTSSLPHSESISTTSLMRAGIPLTQPLNIQQLESESSYTSPQGAIERELGRRVWSCLAIDEV